MVPGGAKGHRACIERSSNLFPDLVLQPTLEHLKWSLGEMQWGLAVTKLEGEAIAIHTEAGTDDTCSDAQAVYWPDNRRSVAARHELVRVDRGVESAPGLPPAPSSHQGSAERPRKRWGRRWSRRGGSTTPPLWTECFLRSPHSARTTALEAFTWRSALGTLQRQPHQDTGTADASTSRRCCLGGRSARAVL